ncbi:glycosyltransferase family 1 protein [Marivibrio halodurans]|uniref:Glycosyltransferase family 1 protein n=1 Tax=Marivibrio halodurans TaxID=2039722 RepID=A0A8J7S302_9PROT|nr:glycosyltransferase family 1 protein [Marivibrio halodurans]MBP5858895.1 glycosyltransferase family 1 protein [Marivibrio halodurans]
MARLSDARQSERAIVDFGKGRPVAIISDAWYPQINGVVRTLQRMVDALNGFGHPTRVIGPDRFRTIPCPSYPEIRLAIDAWARLPKLLDETPDEAIHIATEGPLGQAARRYCLRRGRPFTTAFHTRFPEYVQARIRLPLSWTYGFMRRFHGAAQCTMVTTESMRRDLEGWGFRNLALWTRGVDTDLFHPREKGALNLPRPIFMNVGRVAVEKNIGKFLDLELPGSKVVVGDGPQIAELREAYPEVHFLGAREGEELADLYAAADVFVFPSRTDTFGLVLLEALASGVPVAAYPVNGPIDVIRDPAVGVLDEDLGAAARRALDCDPAACRRYALGYSWDASARQFLDNLSPILA